MLVFFLTNPRERVLEIEKGRGTLNVQIELEGLCLSQGILLSRAPSLPSSQVLVLVIACDQTLRARVSVYVVQGEGKLAVNVLVPVCPPPSASKPSFLQLENELPDEA